MIDDLIKREWLEDAFDNLCCHNCKMCRNFRIEDSFYKCTLIDNAPAVDTTEQEEFAYNEGYAHGLETKRPQGEWIPVSERLPEDMQRVLIWFEYYRYGDFNCMYQTYGFGYVCDGKWSPFINGETGWQDYRVIAWQPLPEPYKEEREEE